MTSQAAPDLKQGKVEEICREKKNYLSRLFSSPPIYECPPVSFENKFKDDFWLQGLPEACEMSGFPHADAFTPDRWLEQGDTVTVGAQTLQVIHCPGHTPGHVVFFHADERLALVGDVLFQGSIGRTDFPQGDHQTLINSIKERLWPLGDDVQFVPGHGPMSTFGQERRSNPFVADQRYG